MKGIKIERSKTKELTRAYMTRRGAYTILRRGAVTSG